MTRRMMCRHCLAVYPFDEIAVPIGKPGLFGQWYNMPHRCPRCKRGHDDWYVSERNWPNLWLDAVRRQRNVKEGSE